MRRYFIEEASVKLGVEKEFILRCIQVQWLTPKADEEPSLDEEDLARLRLILELKTDFGVNDEAVPIILHLLDQLYLAQAILHRHQQEAHSKRRAA